MTPPDPRSQASPEAKTDSTGSGGVTLPADDVPEIIYYLERWRDVRQLVEGQQARNSHVKKLIRRLKEPPCTICTWGPSAAIHQRELAEAETREPAPGVPHLHVSPGPDNEV